jgi:hypothetical protein
MFSWLKPHHSLEAVEAPKSPKKLLRSTKKRQQTSRHEIVCFSQQASYPCDLSALRSISSKNTLMHVSRIDTAIKSAASKPHATRQSQHDTTTTIIIIIAIVCLTKCTRQGASALL